MIALLRAAVPLFLAMVAGTAGSLVVTSVLGNHDTVTLAAFAVISAVLNAAAAAVQGALRGLGPFVAPFREEPAAAVPVVRDARWLSLATGTLGALAVLCVPLLARVTGVPDEVVREMGVLPWLLAVYLLVFASTGGASTILVALGRSRHVLWPTLVFGVGVGGLTALLVPELGLTGVGIAWVVSGAGAAGVAAISLRRALGRPIGQGRPRTREIVKLAKVSIPLAGTVLVKFGVLGVVTFAASTTSTRDTAAHAVLITLTGLIMLASLSVAQAAVPEVARAPDVAGARRAHRAAALLAVTGTLVVAAVLLGLGEHVLTLFTDDGAVRERALGLLPLMLLSSVLDAAQAVQGTGLTALKRSSSSLLSFVIGYGLLVVAAVPVARAWGIDGLWAAMAVANGLLVVLQGTGFHRHSARVGQNPGGTRSPARAR
ncbi:MATE family multidrug resistance protein [Nonomuraea thailandensis]|uniref:Probable multidrug resistance protein NorM n=1 Tax=Nonomuraea thailandensis TaxID=1188745 RepID=A0A9X2GQW4_9ACTN|nr:MATE family efflux transporter [Nonomuraea thailandensis]MCP2363944.1 MATE family multidrug resistance protein [Nonomuraea thailandensis]